MAIEVDEVVELAVSTGRVAEVFMALIASVALVESAALKVLAVVVVVVVVVAMKVEEADSPGAAGMVLPADAVVGLAVVLLLFAPIAGAAILFVSVLLLALVSESRPVLEALLLVVLSSPVLSTFGLSKRCWKSFGSRLLW